jgi:predicted transcriptional regulator
MAKRTTKPKLVLSIHPRFASAILAGTKTIELRRRFSRSNGADCMALIYATAPISAIIGSVVIAKVQRSKLDNLWRAARTSAGVTKSEFDNYFAGLDEGYGLHLSKPTLISTPVPLNELVDEFGFSAPQSFRYLGEKYLAMIRDERLQATH